MPEKSEFPVAPGSHPGRAGLPVLVPGGLRVAGRLGVTACLAQSKVWTFDQTQVPSQGRLGSPPAGRRPQIRGWRAGGSLAVASSTPATPLLSLSKIRELNPP